MGKGDWHKSPSQGNSDLGLDSSTHHDRGCSSEFDRWDLLRAMNRLSPWRFLRPLPAKPAAFMGKGMGRGWTMQVELVDGQSMVAISACGKGRVLEMAANIELNEKFYRARDLASAKAAGNDCNDMAGDRTNRTRSHFVSSSGSANPKTQKSRRSSVRRSLRWSCVVFLC